MVKARLSQCYDKVNIVYDYCAVQIYLHAFSAKALDGDVSLTSTSYRQFPAEGIAGTD